jgi:hypothetical protein
MKIPVKISIFAAAIALCAAFGPQTNGQRVKKLTVDQAQKFVLDARSSTEFSIELKADELCNISTDAAEDIPFNFSLIDPADKPMVKEGNPSEGWIFIAETPGTYRLVFFAPKVTQDDADLSAKVNGKVITVKYSNKLNIPKNAVSKGVRNINGYQAKILDEPGDEGKTYFIIQKAGKTKAVMRDAKEITGGFYFSDDPNQDEGGNAKQSATLMRTTPDKTGDGTPDIAVEYYSGGAHCCFEITFFELGDRVRQLPTIDTANDRMTATGKKPGGGLRFEFAEQAFAYWTINFAQSPMPTVIYEFDKSDELIPRFDLMKKPAPSLAMLKRKATAAKAKIKLNEYTSPDDNFNDFEEPFWDYMLDLIYGGHEDLAWQYFDLVWPAKKKGKEKFLADFKEQLALSTYGEWKKMPKKDESVR